MKRSRVSRSSVRRNGDGGVGDFTTLTVTNQFSAFGVALASQAAAIPNPTGGGTIDVQARAAIVSILNVLRTFGFIAP